MSHQVLAIQHTVLVKSERVRAIPVRILNTSNSHVELHAGKKIARFRAVVESTSTTSPFPYMCASVSNNCQPNPDTLSEVTAAVSPNLNSTDRKKILAPLTRSKMG